MTVLYVSSLFLLYGYKVLDGNKLYFSFIAYILSFVNIFFIPYLSYFFSTYKQSKLFIIGYFLLCIFSFFTLSKLFSAFFAIEIFYLFYRKLNKVYIKDFGVNFKPTNLIIEYFSLSDFIVIVIFQTLIFIVLYFNNSFNWVH